jgi:ABC-2 type transport system ATP-binding protein
MESIVSVRDLRKSFRDKAVLKGVSFEISRGSIFALLGSNGAGKTTAVRILSTLLKADGGSARICGCDVESRADEVRERISLTGQYAAVDEMLTGRENLQLIGKLLRLPDTNRRADELLSVFGLTEDGKRLAKTYSGGMRRRLDIAMSLMNISGSTKIMNAPPENSAVRADDSHSPISGAQVLFLDEPTTGLDPQNRLAMWDMVKNLAGAGVTVLLTTQYLEEAQYLADEIAILHEGQIIASGTLAQLRELFPPAKREYVEVQPTLEEIFLKIIGAGSESEVA